MSARAPRSDAIPLGALRAALQEAIDTRSLRAVAAEIGISHTGLRGLLTGSRPHAHTRRKIERWLTERGALRIREGGEAYPSTPDAGAYATGQAATRALAEALDPRLAGRAAREYHALVLELFRAAGRTPPDWLTPPE